MMSYDAEICGETRLRSRRAAFRRYIGLAFIAGAIGGFATGALGRMAAQDAVPAELLGGFWALIVVAGIWFTRDYFRRIDELDLLDNLWASTTALYAFFITAGSWYILHDTGLAPEPDFAATALFTFAVLIIAYAARKLGWR